LISLVVFPAGLAALALGLVYAPLGRAIGILLSFLNDGIFAVTDFLQGLRSFQTIWPSPDVMWIAAYYVFLALLYIIGAKIKQALSDRIHLGPLQEDPRQILSIDSETNIRFLYPVEPVGDQIRSKTSSTEEWLNYWNPHDAVISVGAVNSYGHPSTEVIERLKQHQIGVFRTDQMGEVQIGVRNGALYKRIKLDS
jgi:hypothetical protein